MTKCRHHALGMPTRFHEIVGIEILWCRTEYSLAMSIIPAMSSKIPYAFNMREKF